MSGRSRVVGLAIAAVLMANGLADKASAGPGACKAVKACEPVKAQAAVPACKPVKPVPLPEVCKPAKTCDGVDAHSKVVAVHDRIVRFVSRFKKHSTGKEVYYDVPQPAPSAAPSIPPPVPAPAPRSPAA